jgi:hypothetical protein
MAFEKYTNVPIYIITTNPNGSTKTSFALAKDFSFENTASINQYRILGKKTHHVQYTPAANKEVSISMNLYIDPSLDTIILLCKLAQQDNGFSLKIGETIINYCYIDSVNYTVSPFQPVILSVACKAYDVESISLIPSTSINENVFDIANGAKSEVHLDGIGESLDILEAGITINSNREIYYAPGQIIPMRCNLTSSELTAQIAVGGVGEFIDYKGKQIYLETVVRTSNNQLCFSLNSLLIDTTDLSEAGYLPCVCSSQQLSVDEGGFITGSLNLNSILV